MVNLMYNPDTLITSKEEQYEIPPAPTFREDPMDAIFRMFQENGTGNPPYIPVDQTTVVRQPEPIKPKLCPFRKKTVFYQNDYTTRIEGEKVMLNLPRAEWMEEEFLPCIREKCAVWNEKGQVCCY